MNLAGSQGSVLATRLDGVRAQPRRREFAAAYAAARALRGRHPVNRDILYLLAIRLRYLDRFPEALGVLAELERYHPTYGRLFEERGFCPHAWRAMEPAIATFPSAARLNSWLPVSWRELERLYRECGCTPEAEATARFFGILERLPSEIGITNSLFGNGDIRAADQLVHHDLLKHRDHIEGTRLVARITMAHDDAEALHERVLRMASGYHAARYEYALALMRQLKHLRAREELEKFLAADPENRDYRIAHATACVRLGDFAAALLAYQKLVGGGPGDAELHMVIGYTLKILGRTTEAIQSYHVAAAVRPGYGNTYWNLANLKLHRFEDAELDQMLRYTADAGTTPVNRYHLRFALGKALEDRGECARSFHHYERSTALNKREIRYRPEFLENIPRLQVATSTREFFAARRGWGNPDAAPIFIVGLPRARSTQIEQVLASHSAVYGTRELPAIAHPVFHLHDLARSPDSPRYPGVLAELAREDCAQLGERYIRETRAHRHVRPFFIDKCRSNFPDLGFIHLILPNARIIDARSASMACCFSNFKQLFAPGAGPEFVYGFEDIAGYYRMYIELMRHWDTVLPGKIPRIQHEELVTDFSATVHCPLEFSNLKPESACFELH